MNAVDLCVPLTKASEGFEPHAYPDPATGGAPWTIGYGSTNGVKQGMVWDRDFAERRMRAYLGTAEAKIRKACDVDLAAHECAALMDFVYNLGFAAFHGSTLLKRLNEGDRKSAADEFERWVYAAGEKLPGLVTRRQRERDLFTTGHWS